MTKELIIAGTLVVVCAGVIAVSFTKPKPPAVASSASGSSDGESVSGSSSSIYGSGTSTNSSSGTEAFPLPPLNSTSSSGTTPTFNPDPYANMFPGSTTGSPGTTPLSSPGTTPVHPPINPLPPPSGSLTNTSTNNLPQISETSTERTHTVAKGDTLADVSKKYYGTSKHWKKIQEANHCDAEGLQVGQKLIIPALASETAATSTPAIEPTGSDVYVVQKGDSYYRIADKQLGDASRAKEIEQLNGVAPGDLRVGQKLKLPSRAAKTGDAPKTPVEAAIPAGARTHTVGKDEYLVDISEKYYGSTKHWKKIADANPGVNPNRLKVGQKLIIPSLKGSTPDALDAAVPPMSSDEAGTYTVKSGDDFTRIAEKTLGDKNRWKAIADANPGVDPTRLRIGQKIKLPAGAKGADPKPTDGKPVDSWMTPPAPLTPVTPTFPAPTTPGAPRLPAPAPAPLTPAPHAPTPNAPIPAPTSDPWNLPPAPAPALPGSGAAPAPANDPWRDLAPVGGSNAGGTPVKSPAL